MADQISIKNSDSSLKSCNVNVVQSGNVHKYINMLRITRTFCYTPLNYIKGIFSDFRKFLWHESEDTTKKAYFQNLMDSNLTFSSSA